MIGYQSRDGRQDYMRSGSRSMNPGIGKLGPALPEREEHFPSCPYCLVQGTVWALIGRDLMIMCA